MNLSEIANTIMDTNTNIQVGYHSGLAEVTVESNEDLFTFKAAYSGNDLDLYDALVYNEDEEYELELKDYEGLKLTDDVIDAVANILLDHE